MNSNLKPDQTHATATLWHGLENSNHCLKPNLLEALQNWTGFSNFKTILLFLCIPTRGSTDLGRRIVKTDVLG
jgi:hypothetical protein